MKNKCFLIALFLLCLFAGSAQYQLNGIVKDAADGSPMPYATVALMHSDSSVVTGVITADDGKFVLEKVAEGDYIMQVSFMGYNKVFRNVNVPAQSDLEEISMTESSNSLSEVTVTATRPLLTRRADRYIVNVSGNILSSGRNALDIFRNSPGLMVDQNGNVTVMGKSVQIWIDGRPSRMSGDQLRAFLNSMQGSEIDRIEIITNPSSRYEAEGSGGIIDIRTKKGLELGLKGTLTAGYRQGHADNENAGINMNLRRQKFSLYGNYSIDRNNIWEKLSQTNVIKMPEGEITFMQEAKDLSTKAKLRNAVRAGMDYFINPDNIVGIIVNAYHSDNGSENLKGVTDISPTHKGIRYSTTDNITSKRSNGIQTNMNYQSKFSNDGQLNIDLDYARFYSKPLMQINNGYYDINSVMIDVPEQLKNSNPQTIDVYAAKTDYSQSIGKDAKFETGLKISQSVTDNDIKFEEFNESVWLPDLNKTNRFVYTEQISAAYINVSRQFKKFDFQAGLRGEYTTSKGEQKTSGEVNDTTYFNLFPTFFANYQPSSKHSFGLSYSRRLNRPSYGYLNPFEISVDAYSFSRGNPDLTPAYTHNLELSYTSEKGLMMSIEYSSTNDMILQTSVADIVTHRTGYSYINFGRMQTLIVMANYRRQIIKKWLANMTVYGGYVKNTAHETSSEFVNKGGAIYAQLYNNITVTPSLSAELTGWYRTKTHSGYTVAQPQADVSIGLRQQLLKNKMNLSLTVNDIFLTNKFKVHTQYENVNHKFVTTSDTRYATLTIRYNFGSNTVKSARNKSNGIEDEASRADGK